MNLAALRLIQRFPHSSRASNLSDNTKMAIGEDGIMTISTLFFDKAVRSPQYDHRTELDDSHWLYCAARAGRGSATCPQLQPGEQFAARCTLQQP